MGDNPETFLMGEETLSTCEAFKTRTQAGSPPLHDADVSAVEFKSLISSLQGRDWLWQLLMYRRVVYEGELESWCLEL